MVLLPLEALAPAEDDAFGCNIRSERTRERGVFSDQSCEFLRPAAVPGLTLDFNECRDVLWTLLQRGSSLCANFVM